MRIEPAVDIRADIRLQRLVSEDTVEARRRMDEFMTIVRETAMSDADRASIPPDTAGFVNAHVGTALANTDSLKAQLVSVIGSLYHLSPRLERFLFDPVRNGPVLVDAVGELVTLAGAEIKSIGKGLQGEGEMYVAHYSHAEVLTGPLQGRTFNPTERGIPPPPIPADLLQSTPTARAFVPNA